MVGEKSRTAGVFKYIIALAALVIAAFPLLWMFRVGVMRAGETIALSSLFRTGFTMQNYRDLFAAGIIARPLFNSLVVGGVVTLGNLLFCFMVGYVLARYTFIGKKLLFATVIGVLMIPAHILIIPLYVLSLKVGIYDSYFALILPWLVNPLGIFLTRQYIETIPPSLEEAARVDGAGEMRILIQVVMPLCKPILAVLAIQVFFTNWNSFLFPFILTSSESVRTLPVALAMLQGHQAIDWQHLMAGSSLAVLPVLVLFLLMQRQIVAGVTAGSVKQ